MKAAVFSDDVRKKIINDSPEAKRFLDQKDTQADYHRFLTWAWPQLDQFKNECPELQTVENICVFLSQGIRHWHEHKHDDHPLCLFVVFDRVRANLREWWKGSGFYKVVDSDEQYSQLLQYAYPWLKRVYDAHKTTLEGRIRSTHVSEALSVVFHFRYFCERTGTLETLMCAYIGARLHGHMWWDEYLGKCVRQEWREYRRLDYDESHARNTWDVVPGSADDLHLQDVARRYGLENHTSRT